MYRDTNNKYAFFSLHCITYYSGQWTTPLTYTVDQN